MTVSIRDLRYRTKEIFQSLKRGNRPVVTYRGHSIAQIVPFGAKDKKSFSPIGHGMWRGHADMKDVPQWLNKQRQPRHVR